jgi:hypothetical protein
MKARIVMGCFTLLALVATAAMGTHLHRATVLLRAKNSGLLAVARAQRTSLKSARQRLAVAQRESDGVAKLSTESMAPGRRPLLNRGLAMLRTVSIPLAPESTTGPLPLLQRKAGKIYFGELLGEPGYAQAAATVERLQIESSYGPLVQELNLSADARSKFFDLLVDRALTTEDIRGLDRTASPQATTEQRVNAAREWQTRMRKALGARVIGQIYAYDQTLLLRSAVDQLGVRAAARDAALTPEQSRDVLRALVADVGSNVRTRYWAISDAGLAKLQSALTPDQFEILGQMNEEQHALIEARDARATRNP